MNPRITKAYRMEPQDYIHNKLMLHIKYESCYSGHHQGKKVAWFRLARCLLTEFLLAQEVFQVFIDVQQVK